MPEDRRLSISSSSYLRPDDIARHTFATARRGFEPGEVRAYLEEVARELAAAADREQDLHLALREAEHRAANPVLDEATLTAALGQETARVLRSAHEAAAELVARAEADASRMRAQAQEESEQLQARTEQNATDRAAQADAAAAELRRRAGAEATSKLEGAKLEAEALVAQSRAECRAMVQEAQELRARVLADLTRRRRVLHSQIEQLRAGRERLAETIGGVRHSVDEITEELFRAEDEARLAAEAAGRQAAARDDLHDQLSVLSVDEQAMLGAEEPAGTIAPEGLSADEESSRQLAVEELFARLRAERSAEGAANGRATPVGPEDAGATTYPDDGGLATAVPGGPPTVAGGEGRAPRAPQSPSGPDAPGAELDAPTGGWPEDSATAAAEEAPGAGEGAGAKDPLLARRDEVLLPMVVTLARRLKRSLQDDQNDVLDRLRAKGGWAPGVLLPLDEHERRYGQAATEQLAEAARAGALFAGGKLDDARAVDALAGELAADIVSPLRRRLEGEGPSVEAGDESALVELVGVAFREWKGARVERLAGDHTVAAFSQGVLAALPAGSTLRWIVDDDDAECPDCDDNALAGPLPAGEAFPTGHVHPPAHVGCRCLLAPGNA